MEKPLVFVGGRKVNILLWIVSTVVIKLPQNLLMSTDILELKRKSQRSTMGNMAPRR